MSRDIIPSIERDMRYLRTRISSLGKLDLLDLAQVKLLKSVEAPQELTTIRDSVFEEGKQWNESSVRDAFKAFRSHEKLNQYVGNSLDDESDLLRYFLRIFRGDDYKSALYDCFNILCQASTVEPEFKKSFFTIFPPPRSDLACLGGTGTRFGDIFIKMQAKKGFQAAVIDALSVSMAQMVEVIKPYLDVEYQIHILSCLRYVFGLVSEEEVKKIDPHAIPVLYNIPYTKMVEIFDGFLTVFRDRLLKSLSEVDIEEAAENDLRIAKKNATLKAYQDPDYKEYEANQLSSELFDNSIRGDELFAMGDDPRVAAAIGYFSKDLEKYGLSGTVEDIFEYREGDDSYLLKTDDIRRQLMDVRMGDFISTAPEYLKGQTIDSVLHDGEEVSEPVHHDQITPSVNIDSKEIVGIINNLIHSDDSSDKAKAIEILYSLCNKSPGVPYVHFLEIMDSEIGIKIRLKLGEIAESKFKASGQILPDSYIYKITNFGNQDLRDGILERYFEYKEIAKYDTGQSPYNTLFASSTETITGALKMMKGVGDDLVKDIILTEGNYLEILVNRGDFASAILPIILDGNISAPRFNEVNILTHLLDNGIANAGIFMDILSSANEDDKVAMAKETIFRIINNPDLEYDELEILEYNELEMLRVLVRAAPNLNMINNSDGNTPLFVAAENNHANAVRLLIAAGADPNIADNKIGKTPLYIAAQKGHAEVVKELIAAGANLDIVDKEFGNKPLYIAAQNGHDKVVKELIAAGADPNIAYNKIGKTPLYIAVENNHANAVRLLIEADADPNIAYNKIGKALLYIAAQDGHDKVVKELIVAAIKEGDIDTLKQFFNIDANIAYIRSWIKERLLTKGDILLLRKLDIDLRYIMYFAAQDGLDLNVRVLIDEGIDFKGKNKDTDKTPLFVAVENNHVNVVKVLIEKGVNPNDISKRRTALGVAAENGIFEIVSELINAGVVINERRLWKDELHKDPLYYAAQENHFDVLKLLIESQNSSKYAESLKQFFLNSDIVANGDYTEKVVEDDVNELTKFGFDPNMFNDVLLYAEGVDIEIVKMLIPAGAEIDSKDARGKIPLCVAAKKGRIDVVELLIEKGANLNVVDKSGKIPLCVAAEEGNLEIVSILIAAGAEINPTDPNHNPLCSAAKGNNVEVVKELIAAGAKISDFALGESVNKGNLEIASLLIEAGAKVDSYCLWAVANSERWGVGHKSIQKSIIEKLKISEADIHKVLMKHDIQTAIKLQEAVDFTLEEVIDYALKNGFEKEYPSILRDYIKHYGGMSKIYSCIYSAAEKGNVGVVKILMGLTRYPDNRVDIYTGINTNEVDADSGKTPLYIAAEKGHAEVVKELIKGGAFINKKIDRFGTVPLWIVAAKGDTKILNMLIKAGANIDESCTHNGSTPLIIATQYNRFDVVKALIEAGADLDKRRVDDNGSGPLHIAIIKNNLELVTLLVESNAKVDEPNNIGTPLCIATTKGNIDIVRKLIAAGADPNIADKELGTPLHIAAEEGHADIVKELIAAGANLDIADKYGENPLYVAAGKGHAEIVKELIAAGADFQASLEMASKDDEPKILEILEKYSQMSSERTDTDSKPLGSPVSPESGDHNNKLSTRGC